MIYFIVIDCNSGVSFCEPDGCEWDDPNWCSWCIPVRRLMMMMLLNRDTKRTMVCVHFHAGE